jgi:hypothetical protein
MVAKTEPFTFLVGAPGIFTMGTNFPYTVLQTVNNAVFTRPYNGNNLSILYNTSAVQITNAYLSIPNLPGIQISNTGGQAAEIQCEVIASGGVVSPFSLSAYQLDLDMPINQSLYSPTTGENFQLRLKNANLNWMYLDTRNTLAAYNGVSVFLQIEIDIYSPYSFVG